MPYTTVNNRVLDLDELDPAEVDFWQRLERVVADDGVSTDQMRALVYGPENPALDHEVMPGQPLVTKVTLDNPLFWVCVDCLSRKDIRAGRIDLAQAHAAYTVDVPSAAEQLGVSPQAVRAGIDSFKYDALFARGQWWMRPETVASLRLSRAGGRLKRVNDPA